MIKQAPEEQAAANNFPSEEISKPETPPPYPHPISFPIQSDVKFIFLINSRGK